MSLFDEFRNEYKAWHAAKQRCTMPSNQAYSRYGGRGIQMCDRWLSSWESFLADMGPCPPGLTLERIDNNGDYSPSNCTWASRTDQMNNRHCCRLLTNGGETLTLSQWAKRSGLDKTTLYSRLKRGWSVERAITEVRYSRVRPSSRKYGPLSAEARKKISKALQGKKRPRSVKSL